MTASAMSPAEDWLTVSKTDNPLVFKTEFQERHIGNPLIRSVHGGVVGMLIEHSAAAAVSAELQRKGTQADTELVTNSIDYLRVTKDAPLYARAEIVRVARRIAFVDVWVWQDSEDLPVSRGACTLRILETPVDT